MLIFAILNHIFHVQLIPTPFWCLNSHSNCYLRFSSFSKQLTKREGDNAYPRTKFKWNTNREKINLQKCYRLFAELLGRSSIIPILFLLLTSWRAQNHSFPLILLTLILKYTKSLDQLHSVNFFTSALLLCVKSRHSDEKLLTSSKQIWLQLCQNLLSGDVYLTSLTPWTKYFSS